MMAKSSSDTCVKYGLPAHSPIAQTFGAVVSRRSFTRMCPFSVTSIPAFSSPMPLVLGVRPSATRMSVPSTVRMPFAALELKTYVSAGKAIDTRTWCLTLHRCLRPGTAAESLAKCRHLRWRQVASRGRSALRGFPVCAEPGSVPGRRSRLPRRSGARDAAASPVLRYGSSAWLRASRACRVLLRGFRRSRTRVPR